MTNFPRDWFWVYAETWTKAEWQDLPQQMRRPAPLIWVFLMESPFLWMVTGDQMEAKQLTEAGPRFLADTEEKAKPSIRRPNCA